MVYFEMTGIYKITNLINNKIYIGQSKDIEKRIKEHFWKAKCEKDISYNSALHSAIRKYGENNFKWDVVEECDMQTIDEKERYYIQAYNSISPNGYNILIGGQSYRISIKPKYCEKCGKEIWRDSRTNLCRKCYNISISHCPSKYELEEILKKFNGNFSKAGRYYNVTDNAIRKWCISYGMPTHSSDYKNKRR